MKIIVASDLHGSLHYGNMLYHRFLAENGEKLIILGDIYYHGPRNNLPNAYDPMALSNLLNSIKDKLLVIKGNCDSEVDEMVSEFPFLPTTNLEFNGLVLTLTHGHHYDIDNFPEDVGDILLYGHIHQGFITKKGNTLVANPGSTTLPRGGTPRSYIVISKDSITLKNLETTEIIDSLALK